MSFPSSHRRKTGISQWQSQCRCPSHLPEKTMGHLVSQMGTGTWESLGKPGGMVWASLDGQGSPTV